VTSRPLYLQLKERIRADLLDAPASSSMRLPTERELQVRYGVSRPTISKALAALAGEGFLIQKQRRGRYWVQPSPDTPADLESPRLIGYVAPLAGEELVQRVFRGVDRVAHRHNYRVLMGNSENNVVRERAVVFDLIASGVRGIVIMPFYRRTTEVESDYLCRESLGVPAVLVDTCAPEQGHAHVVFDNRRAGYAMTEWLIRQGHRRIGLLSYAEEILHIPLQQRWLGYRDALRDYSLPYDPALVCRYDPGLDQEMALQSILDEWLGWPERPTAIISVEDMCALQVIDLLDRRGVGVPAEVTVVGFDNRRAARWFRIPFTTTAPDFERMGEVAGELLLNGIESRYSVPRTYVLDVPLLVRHAETPPALKPQALVVG
jgi:DNA-binding LacI/PurR family transcriptional regulator